MVKKFTANHEATAIAGGKKRKWTHASRLLLAIALLAGLAACGGSGGNPSTGESLKADDYPTAVKLAVYNWGNFTDDEFQKMVVEPVGKKYPSITLEQIKRGKNTQPADLVAAGTAIDMIITNNDTLDVFDGLHLLRDIDPEIKKQPVDLNRFEKSALERSKYNGKLVGLPFSMKFSALFYNKDIFDKFGISYPQDGMTVEELVELAKKLTRQEQGVQYRGFDPQSIYAFTNSMPLALIDPKTDKASVNTDLWKYALTLYHDIVTIPGNAQQGTAANDIIDGFLKQQNVAIIPNNIINQLEQATQDGFNWDMAQSPSFKNRPNIAGDGQTTVLAIAQTSGHADDVMKVIDVLTSAEVQTLSSRSTARQTALASKDIQNVFGADMAFLKGKHTEAIFKSHPMTPDSEPASPYERDMRPIFNTYTNAYFQSKSDLNSALRSAEEEMNKKIAELKAQ